MGSARRYRPWSVAGAAPDVGDASDGAPVHGVPASAVSAPLPYHCERTTAMTAAGTVVVSVSAAAADIASAEGAAALEAAGSQGLPTPPLSAP